MTGGRVAHVTGEEHRGGHDPAVPHSRPRRDARRSPPRAAPCRHAPGSDNLQPSHLDQTSTLEPSVGSVIGVDIGGSKTHGVRAVDGRPVAEALAGSANLASVGTAEAARQLRALIARLGADGVDAVCAGAAGGGGGESVGPLHRGVADLLPGARVSVVHDARLVLAAAGLDAGVALISGTGSVAWGSRADGTEARAGGWGHLLGDEGSGYRIALDAVRHALDRMDAGAPVDALTTALLERCGLAAREQLIDHVYATQDRRYWAGHAATVVELSGAGDVVAGAILDAAADAAAAPGGRGIGRPG